jgi:hypothetical protein
LDFKFLETYIRVLKIGQKGLEKENTNILGVLHTILGRKLNE